MPTGESSKHAIQRSAHNTNLSETAMHASCLVLSLVKEAAALAPCSELRQAAAVALIIFETIEAVKDNKEAYKRLGDDSAALIVAIWRSYKKAESPKEWLSADMQEILVELTHVLDHICSFVREKLARGKAMRVIYSRADAKKIADYRENLNSAMQKFELQSHMNIDLKLGKLSEQLRYRNGEDMKRVLEISAREARDLEETESIHEQELKVVKKFSTLEIDHQAKDEREHSEELKKHEKGKDRQSELERLRAAVRAVEMENRLKKAEEEEIAELRQKIAAGRRNTMPLAQPSKKSSTQEDEFEDKKDWRRKEQEELGRKANHRRSPDRRHGTLETFTDDEEERFRKSKMRAARQKLSSSSPHFEETEDQSTDEEPLRRSKMRTARQKLSSSPPHFEETEDQSSDEERPPPPKKGPKARIPPGSPLREVDDLLAQFQGFGTPVGSSPHGRSSTSPMYSPLYGTPSPPSMAPNGFGWHGYGYGGGMPGTVVNTGVGNITSSIISNVGNDNSVQKVYRAPRNRRT